MSVVTLEEAKEYMRVIHTADDALIQDLIDDAEDECLQFLDRTSLPRIGVECPDDCDTAYLDNPVSDGADFPRSLRKGILFIVQAAYEGKDADEVMKIRRAAETVWSPYRCNYGA